MICSETLRCAAPGREILPAALSHHCPKSALSALLLPRTCRAIGIARLPRISLPVSLKRGYHVMYGSPPMRSIGLWIAILAIVLFVVAWHYGIITSVALVWWSIIVGIWNLLCDVGNTFKDFIKDVFSQPLR